MSAEEIADKARHTLPGFEGVEVLYDHAKEEGFVTTIGTTAGAAQNKTKKPERK